MTNILSLIASQPRKSSTTILIVDNSETDRATYSRYLQSDLTTSYHILEAETLQAGLELWQSQHLDVVLIDFNLPDGDGLELLEAIGQDCPEAKVPVILLTEQENEQIAMCSMKKGAIDYLVKKDITQVSLSQSIHSLLEITTLNRKIDRLQKQETLISGISLHIQQSLSLEDIYQAIVQEVCAFLNVDRTVIYKFNPDMSGEIVAEAIVPPWQSCLHTQVVDMCFQENMGEQYQQGKIFAVTDIYAANLTKCHLQLLERFQVRANLVIPILIPKARFHSAKDKSALNTQSLWGLLIVHQCCAPREWENTEISLMQQLSVQLAIAVIAQGKVIQQAEISKNVQTFNTALQEKVEARTQELQASERRFRAIFDNTCQFTGLLTTEGILLEANQTALNFGRIKLEDIVNKPFWEANWWTISPTTQEKLKQAISQAAQGEFIRYEVDVLGAGGQIATIDFSLRPLKDESGQVEMLIAEGRDISDKKHIEYEHLEALKALKASEAELRGLFNAMVDVILVVDKQGRYLKIAPTNADKLYRPAEELLGKTAHEVLPYNLADQFVRVIEQTLATQQTSKCEYSLQISNREIWFSAKVSPISPETVIWAARDITEAKHNEIIRQQTDQALQESQILLQLVMDSLPMAIFWKDKNSRYLGCNRQLLLDAGLSSVTEIVGKTDFDMVWKEQASLYQEDDRIVMESGQSKFNIEEPFTKSGNIPRWLRTNKIPLHKPDGDIFGVLASYEDITEHKQIQQALQESEQRYATLVTSAPVGIYRADAQGNCLYVNDYWCENTGLTPQEAAGWGWKNALHPEDRDLVEAQWQRLVQTGETFSLEYRFVRPDGVETWVFGQAVPETDSAGTVTGYVGTVTNITRSKQAEAALRRSEQLYRTLVDNFPNGVVVLFDHDLRYLLIGGGQEIARAGLHKAEMEGKTIWEIFAPEVCEIIAPLFRQALAGESVVTEVPYQDFFYLTYYIPVRDEQGNVIAGILMTQNITERKQAENALRDSEEKFRQFTENSRQLMLLRQVDSGKLLYVNPAYEQIWGRSKNSLYENPNSWMSFLHPDDRERIDAAYQATNGQGFFSEEYRIIRPDGAIRWIWGRCFPIRDFAGEVYRIGAIAEDITERKQTEQERDRLLAILEQQNQTLEAQVNQRTAELRAVIDAIPDYVFVIERQEMRIIYCNNTFAQEVCQQPREQIEGKTIFAALPKQNAENCHQQNQIVFGSGEILRIQDTYNSLDNTYTFDTIKVPLKQANGEVYALVGTSRDITAIKQLELALNESKERFRNLVETSSDWVWEVNESGMYTYVSPQIINVLGYSPEEVLGKTPFDLMPPAEAERVLKEFMKFVSVQAPFQCLENTNRHKDGRLITLETSAVPIFDAEQQFRGYRGMDRDITVRKISEAALRQSEARFQRIAANVPGTMYQYVLHADGFHEFVYISDGCRELYELESTTVLENVENVFKLTHPEDAPSLEESIILSASSLQQWSWEGRVITPSGRLKWIRGVSQPQKQANGDILWDGLIFDISDRKQSEAKLQSAEVQLRNLSERLKLAVTSAKIGIWDLDLVNDSLVWDDRIYQLFGVSRATLNLSEDAWAKFETLLYPDDRVRVRETVQAVIAEDKELDTEFRIIWPNGTIRILKAYGLVQHNSQGQPQRMIGINFDITERKLAESEILHSRDLREAIFNESADALFLVDAETVKTIDCNQRAVEMFAATYKTDLIGIEGHQLQKQQFTTRELEAINNDIENQGFWSREVEYKTFHGDLFWGNLAAKQITVAGQKMNLVRVTDISDRKLAEAQLQETNKQLAASNEQLARATRLKDEFLANMSHELRTPLNSILGLSEGLLEEVFGTINEKQRRSLQTIERSGSHLLALINDILDLSKIEAGQVELDCTPIVISHLCQASLSFIKQQAFQKQIQLKVKLQPNLPELVVDERRIRQVLINLLNNAVKFTPEGGSITLEVTREQHTPEPEITYLRDFIRIVVIDTGIGIAPENLHKLFQPFVQIDSSLNRQYAGTGLGLSLVKRIVEMHGGTVSVSSQVGVGSLFMVDLPCTHISASSPQSVNQSQPDLVPILNETVQESPLILLAEDNEANILTVSSYLEAKGYRMILAKTGQQAIEMTKFYLPDLILMDIQMPGMDGLEAMRQIRLNPDLLNLPIIALTALAMPGDQEKCLAAGANEYLTKPLKLKPLADTIQKFLEESANSIKT